MSESHKRLQTIDMLRGLAALAVLALHIPHHNDGGWRLDPVFFPGLMVDYGYLGVPLFVIISGFCIHRGQALAKSKSLHWGAFWKRRFWRLYPPYVAAAVVSLLAARLLYSKSTYNPDLLGWDIVTHSLLLHNLTAEFGTKLGNAAFWSLGMEEQLYLLYMPLFWVMTRWSVRQALLLSFLTTVCWRTFVAFDAAAISLGPFSLGSWYLWPFQYWLHWTLGAYAVEIHLGNVPRPRWAASWATAIALLMVGVVLNGVFFKFLSTVTMAADLPGLAALDGGKSTIARWLSLHGEVCIAFGFFIALTKALEREQRQPMLHGLARLFALIGLMSYSVYLIHIPVIYVLEEYVAIPFTTTGWFVRYGLYGGASLLMGIVFYLTVERRFLARKVESRPESLPRATIRNAQLPFALEVESEACFRPSMATEADVMQNDREVT